MVSDLTWVEPGILSIGQRPTTNSDLLKLSQSGIRAVITLREEGYPKDWQYFGLDITHIPIQDMSIPSPEQIEDFLITVQYHFERSEPVYVHCTAGCGRTGVMIAIWLASLRRFSTIEEIIRYLRQIRPCAIETKEQLTFVKERANAFLS